MSNWDGSEIMEHLQTQLEKCRAERDELRGALERLLDGSQHCGEMQWCGEDAESPWDAARAALAPKGE